jgi:hypothetical protein
MRVSGDNINYIQASENFGNLESAMDYYRDHDKEAEEIAKNSYNTFARRYLTPAAVSPSSSVTPVPRANLVRSHVTGDVCSGPGHRFKATSRNSMHQTQMATW